MSAQTHDRPLLSGVSTQIITLPPTGDTSPLRMHVATAGKGPPLLLLHGAPQNHLAWAALIAKFAQHYQVICPDLRGAGWTEAPDQGYDPVSLMHDIQALMQAYNLTQTNIIAHDWSAIIALRLATEHPELIDRLVVLSIPDFFIKPDFNVMKLLLVGWFNLVLPLPVIGPLVIRSGSQSMLRYMHSLTGSQFRGPLPYAEEDRRLLRDPQRAKALSLIYRHTIIPTLIGLIMGRERRRFLSVPTLQLMGAEDPAAALMHMGRYEGRTASLRYEELPGSSHYLLEEAPEQIYRKSLEFFTEAQTSREDSQT